MYCLDAGAAGAAGAAEAAGAAVASRQVLFVCPPNINRRGLSFLLPFAQECRLSVEHVR